MKFKFLLFSMLLPLSIIYAQEPYRSLVITEARLTHQYNAYIELTNMGDQIINLSEFEIGKVGPWTFPVEVEGEWTLEDWFNVGNDFIMLPNAQLEPGESYVVGSVADWRPEMLLVDPYEYGYQPHKEGMDALIDFKIHYPEPPGQPPADSITNGYTVLEVYGGRDCWYVRHHYSETDSAVIDQVGGVFDEDDGTNKNGAYDVAGVTEATGTHILVRKSSITTGNIDFKNGRGIDLDDSEWIPIPRLGTEGNGNRAPMWTIGNHGDYILDESTLESNTVTVNMEDETIMVPWGIRRDDSLMFQFAEKEGLAWHYHYSESFDDSAYISVRNGDKLTIYICGQQQYRKDFDIIVSDPTEDANIVMPKKPFNYETGYYEAFSAGIYAAFCYVTQGVTGMDTIKHNNGITGISFATRKDSLLKYLEKAPNASWEFIWVDGLERTDLKNGDILRVTAGSGVQKDYYIKVDEYLPSHDAYLSSITWPDIPGFYKGLFGWIGDTIPNFTPTSLSYRVEIPADVEGIPALVAQLRNLNASLEVKRATNLYGSEEDKTVRFTATAEDDTSVLEYKVVLDKKELDKNVQPYHAEPIMSEFIFWESWSNNFIEICNPGNQVLDLSNYMFYFGGSDNPASAIEGQEAWEDRYKKYIPGYKWTSSEESWIVQHSITSQDLNVNPIIQPGDVFVMGHIFQYKFANQYQDWYGQTWWVPEQCDIDFANDPWGEGYNSENSAARSPWTGANFYMYKILNDSVKQGLKPATDPNDFELIETWGMGDGSVWQPLGVNAEMVNSFKRKPEFFLPKPGFKESFGETPEESEWTMTDRWYYNERNVGWPQEVLFIADGLGSHNLDPITIFKSTVTSLVYKVSRGYSHEEGIRGIVTGTTVSDFMDNIIKADTGQALLLKAQADGTILQDADVLANGDSLIVTSADSVNVSKYILEVTDDGLSDDAVITSDIYTVSPDQDNPAITGFEYGTTLQAVIDAITLPAGATMQVIDHNDAYIPLKKLNFDTTYVDVLVNDQIYFEVVAEDGKTKIKYQLQPNAEESDAFVTSTVYNVDQDLSLIDLIPEGTTVSALIDNLVPVRGATIKIVDKLGNERNTGYLYLDDKVVVTAADMETTKIYYMTMLNQKVQNVAYLLSDVYEVDQLTLTVYVSDEQIPLVSEVLANLQLAPGATILVTDSDGVDKGESDPIVEGDLLKVTAENGVIESYYTISIVTSIEQLNNSLHVYPNPTSNHVYLTGLHPGAKIDVYNVVGVKVIEKNVISEHEMFSLENQTHGLYFIVITNDNSIIAQYKILLQ